ncbi:MAG: hypothetical protein ACFCUI_09690, partial [Bernardetiaceae bacterium]
FDAAYFAGAGDRKAIDILRKVPGIDVRQDGSIYYKGKRISDILIDGESLFDQSPETLARAFPADALDKIQVLENYTAFGNRYNPLGEAKALNFTIRDDKKNVVFGEVSLSGGRGESGKTHYRAEGNAFWLKKKVKTLWISDFNNTGEHVFDLRSYARFVGYDNLGNLSNAPVGRTPSKLPPEIQTEFGALSLVLRSTETFRFQANGFFNRTQTHERTELNRRYFSVDLTDLYQENQRQTNENRVGAGKLMATFVPNQSHALTFQLRLHPQKTRYESEQQTFFLDTRNQSQMAGNTKHLLTELQSTYLLTFDEQNTLDADLILSYQPHQEALVLASEEALFPALLPLPAQNGFLQESLEKRTAIKASAMFRHQFAAGFSVEAATGIDHQRENHSFDAEQLPDEQFDRSGVHRLQKRYASSSFKWQRSFFTWEGSLCLAHYDWRIRQPKSKQNRQAWRMEPRLDLRFNLATAQQLKLSFERSNELPQYIQFLESIQIQDFRMTRRGSAALNLFYTDSYQIAYTLNYLFSEVMIFTTIGYENTPQAINSAQTIEERSEWSTPIQTGQESIFFTLNASKGFNKNLPLFLRFGVNIFQSNAIHVLNNVQQTFQNLTQNYTLSAQTRFKKSFNATLELKASLFGSGQTSSQLYTLTNVFFWQPFSFLYARLHVEQMHLRRGDQSQHFFLLGSELSATITPSTNLGVNIHNLNNLKAVDSLQLYPLFEQQRRQDLLQRFFVLSLVHRI